jgi:hypothetical protein
MRRKHMVDEKEIKKPGEISKETKKLGEELSEEQLEKAAGGGPNDVPTESVTVTFQKVEWSY